jgi:hypothetical protein
MIWRLVVLENLTENENVYFVKTILLIFWQKM